MAEASCSGGTPFKQLIDHQARDVSHHQDRLVDRAGALGSSSFRSSPAQLNQPQNGFGAFMGGGNSALPGFQHDPAGRLAVHAASLQPLNAGPAAAHPEFSRASPAPEAANWAADFSRVATQQRPVGQLSHVAQSRQMNQSPASQLNFQSAFAQPNMAFGSAFGMANGAFMAPGVAQQQQQPVQGDFDQEMSRWMSAHGGGNMQDVDAAMDQMARELEQSEAVTAPEAEIIDNTRMTDLETPEIGNLSLESREAPLATTEQEQVDLDNHAKSAVAEAAEKLLDCVKHEGGEKWQNSVFLSLMRDFRDGRKDIVGDEIRTSDEAPAIEAQT
ncbi:hypothetical protein PT974_11904 [Cladobotryum mycophilum]|uniref:Peroxin 20 n=1 Tax=Cladobotryum mycophilum TaxID=491253 RepID=A0ABR0S7Z5_9HYPO